MDRRFCSQLSCWGSSTHSSVPIIVIMTLPLTILTLGLFLLIINAAMLSLAAWLLDGMTVARASGRLFSARSSSPVTGWIASSFISDRGNCRDDHLQFAD